MTLSAARISCALLVAFAAGPLVTSAAGQAAPAPAAQGGRGGGPNFAATKAKIEKITGNFYTVRVDGPDFYPSPNGRPAGTIGVLAGPDGVFMVDAMFAPLSDKIAAAIRTVQPDGRIRFLVNTHVHPDHTGGDENFGKMGVTLLAHENLRRRLATPREGAAAPAAVGLPGLTYDAPLTFRMNGDEVRVIPVMNAHTDGDSIVYFVNADVVMTGDIFRADNAFPNMDLDNGGSLAGILAGLDTIINTGTPNTKVIPGHGPIMTKADVAKHRDMIASTRDKVAALAKQGKTLQEVQAAGLTAEGDKAGLQNGQRFVGQLYTEVTRR